MFIRLENDSAHTVSANTFGYVEHILTSMGPGFQR